MQRYAITERGALPAHPRGSKAALVEQAQRWVGAGVEWIQIREKDLPLGELEELAERLAACTRGTATRLLLNGLGAQAARACGVDGVHLPGGVTAAHVRAVRGAIGLVSVSCHTLADVREACAGGAAALLWAPVFGKVVGGTEVQPGSGLQALRAACVEAEAVPVFALGGVDAGNAQSCVEAGAAGIAGIRLFAGEGWRALR